MDSPDPGMGGGGGYPGDPAGKLRSLGPQWGQLASIFDHGPVAPQDAWQGVMDAVAKGGVPSAQQAFGDVINASGGYIPPPPGSPPGPTPSADPMVAPAPGPVRAPGYIPAGYQRDPSGTVTPQASNLRAAMMAGPAFGGWQGSRV